MSHNIKDREHHDNNLKTDEEFVEVSIADLVDLEVNQENGKPSKISGDTIALIAGGIIVALVIALLAIFDFSFEAVSFPRWNNLGELSTGLFNTTFLLQYLGTWLFLALGFATFEKLSGSSKFSEAVYAFTVLYLLASVVYTISGQTTMRNYLEYAFWALIIGLLIGNVFGVPDWLKPALKSDTFVKVGLVLMGTEVIFQNILNFGAYGLIIVIIVVGLSFLFMWWFGNKVLKMEDPATVAVITTATTVCGVSAAVAASASVKAKKESLSLTVSMTAIVTVIMMVVMPYIAQGLGLSELVGGAWIGNTVDSTGAVVLAGEAYGPVASQVASMIKMIQNMMIGLISFVLAVVFARMESKQKAIDAGEPVETAKVSPSEIWKRVPKFILGFVGMSVLFSFIVQPTFGVEATNEMIDIAGSWKGWFFCLTFLAIGLETNFKEMMSTLEGGKPVTLYLVGQTFSVILSLILCIIILGGVFWAAPTLIG